MRLNRSGGGAKQVRRWGIHLFITFKKTISSSYFGFIQGVAKDIQQLYSAIDLRLEALRKSSSTTSTLLSVPDSGDDASPQSHGPTPRQ